MTEAGALNRRGGFRGQLCWRLGDPTLASLATPYSFRAMSLEIPLVPAVGWRIVEELFHGGVAGEIGAVRSAVQEHDGREQGDVSGGLSPGFSIVDTLASTIGEYSSARAAEVRIG